MTRSGRRRCLLLGDAGLLGLALVVWVVVLVVAVSVGARGHGFSAEENEWLNRQRALDGEKCCDERDAHVAPNVEWRVTADRRGYEVRINGEWRLVPAGRIMRENPADPSPWGQAALLFHAPWAGGPIYCFRPEPLM